MTEPSGIAMDIARIEQLIEVLEGSRSEELCVRKGELSVCIKRGPRPTPKPVQPAQFPAIGSLDEPVPEEELSNERLILAPMVGIFHAVDGIMAENAQIKVGQVVGSIESMKLLNDIISDVSGAVRETMVEDGTPVEYGQPLCKIEVTV
jgi:acetyl-CoA carboxylase biotin carboxyl carrier protein